MTKQASMRERVAHSFADLIQGELNDMCPQESMSRFLFTQGFDGEATVCGCRFEAVSYTHLTLPTKA